MGLPPLSTPMMESIKDMYIDLDPKNYSSERKKPHEPIFGPGLPDALAYVISFAITVTALYWLRH